MDLLTTLFLGTPLWMWLTFLAIVITLLVLDLGVLNRGDHEIGVRRSLWLSALYITLGLGFSGFVWWQMGGEATSAYLTAFVVEKTLAMDNVFVIALIFSWFAIPRQYQHRVLFWGILGVIVLRGIMIGLGATLVAQYGWILYVFAGFLIFTGLKMLFGGDHEPDLAINRALAFLRRRLNVTDGLRGNAFFVREPDATGRLTRYATPLFLALVLIEIADLVFAVDSVPAVFAITTDPFIVFTSNIFAIMGLRALYFLLADMAHRFHLLKYGLAMVLTFIGAKMLIMPWYHMPTPASLAIVAILLLSSIVASLIATRPR